MEKTIKGIIIDTISNKLSGLGARVNEEGNVLVYSEMMTDFRLFLEVSQEEDFFWIGAIEAPEERDMEIVTKIFKSISLGLYKGGYYPTSFSSSSPTGLYCVRKEQFKITSKFSDVFEALKEIYEDTTVKISKKGNRIIISGVEGSVVLKKPEGLDKAVVESGLSLALRFYYDSLGLSSARLRFFGVFELYDYN